MPQTTITLAPELDAILAKIAKAGVRHPIDLTTTFLMHPVQVTFSLGADGLTPTAHLCSTGAHQWPYESDPATSFDDRNLA